MVSNPMDQTRRAPSLIGALLMLMACMVFSCAARADGFDAFVAGLWPEAQAKGVSRATFDAAFEGVTPDQSVIDKSQTQAEFHKTVGEYLSTAVSDKRVALGQEKFKAYQSWLAKAEERYGVDRFVILGVWGLETKYGTYMGDNNVIRALSTLAAASSTGSSTW